VVWKHSVYFWFTIRAYSPGKIFCLDHDRRMSSELIVLLFISASSHMKHSCFYCEGCHDKTFLMVKRRWYLVLIFYSVRTILILLNLYLVLFLSRNFWAQDDSTIVVAGPTLEIWDSISRGRLQISIITAVNLSSVMSETWEIIEQQKGNLTSRT